MECTEQKPKKRKRKQAKEWDVIKVQMPIFHMEEEPEVLLYNEDRSIFYLTPVDDYFRGIMEKELKKFFYFKMENGYIVLGEEAAWQPW